MIKTKPEKLYLIKNNRKTNMGNTIKEQVADFYANHSGRRAYVIESDIIWGLKQKGASVSNLEEALRYLRAQRRKQIIKNIFDKK